MGAVLDSMTATQTTTTATEKSTPALALSYFAGFDRGETYAAAGYGIASIETVVLAFAAAVALRKVGRETFKAFRGGWRAAELLTAAVS